MKKLLLTAIATGIATFALAATVVAKEPHEVKISGGDLTHEVTFSMSELTGEEAAALLGDPLVTQYVDPPLPFPETIYTVTVYGREGNHEFVFDQLTYYPGHDGQPAALRQSNMGFVAVGDKLQAVLDGSIASAAPDGSDGRSLVWYIAPSLALGLVFVGSSIVGRRLLLRRHGED